MKLRIMIIDAHPVFALRTQGFLGSMGLEEAEIVSKGDLALEIFSKSPAQLIILSETLPDAQSLDIAKAIIRQSPRSAVIVQTGLLVTPQRLEEFRIAGVSSCVARREKNWEEFEAAVYQALDRLNQGSNKFTKVQVRS